MLLSILQYIFFAAGLSNFANYIFKKNRKIKLSLLQFPIPIEPIIAFIGILVYSSFSNLFLLIPGIIKLLHFSNIIILKSLTFSKLLLSISFYFFFLCGIFCLIIKIYKVKFKIKITNISFILDNIYFPLILSFLIFFFLSPKNPDFMIFDTGLYHYPFIKHLSEFAIEPGLSELEYGYGIYNLNFFGQIPLHNLFSTSKYMSPSINILLFAFYIWFFTSEYFLFKKEEKSIVFLNIKYDFIILSYFIINFTFCSSSIISDLSSYTPNLAIFITGSICFYIIFSSGVIGERKFGFVSIYLLTIFAPLLKTTALTICLLNSFYFVFFYVRTYSIKFSNKIYLIKYIKNLYLYIKKQILLENILAIPLMCYLIAIITNIFLSGYIIFPITFTGPISNWALEPSYLNHIQEISLNWPRYSGNIPSIENKSNLFIWFPYFLFSRNGLIFITYWFLPNVISTFINFLKSSESYVLFKNNINLSDHITIFSIFAFINIIFLIPVPSYTPWLTPIIIFLAFISFLSILSKSKLIVKLQKALILFCFTIMVIGSFKVSYTNKNIWSNLFKDMHFFSKFPYLEYQTVEFNPKKWKPLLKNKNEPIIINISKSNQCWNIPAPCVPKNNISPKFFVK